MIDVLEDDLLDFNEVAKLPPFRRKGKAANISTIFRLAQRGARSVNGDRVRLETVKTPSGMRTSREAVRNFISLLSGGDELPSASIQRENDAAADELSKAGFEVGG